LQARQQHPQRRYGTSIEKLEKLLADQCESCAICHRHWRECVPAKKSRYDMIFLQRLCVDHDHKTGRVRGLLCNACNTAIGLFEEDVARFREAAAYIDRATEA
jgi:hypothetical protein